jgi:Flp pilus assembly protein TadD
MTTLARALERAVKHHQAGELQQAEQLYREILQVDPNHIDALHLLGLIAHQFGRSDVAIDLISQAIRLKPDFAEAHNNLAIALKELGRLDQAVASYQQAVALKPDYVEAHSNLAVALVEQGRLGEAVASAQRAVRLKPDFPEAHNNLGMALKAQGSAERAVASFQQAVRLKPDYAEAHNNLGVVLADLGRLEEAVAGFQQAVRLKPDYAEAHNNLGVVLADLSRVQEAVACYQRALSLKPDYAAAHNNLGIAWLLMGNFHQGWPEYEWRWKCTELKLPSYRQPLWDGSPLNGRTILLLSEQGLGDTIQFIRFAPLVARSGGRVIVICRRPMARLLAGCPGIAAVVAEGEPLPEFDVYAPLLSLPGLLGTTLATVPAEVPYLTADPAQVDFWHRELSAVEGFRIGIAWQGSPGYRRDRFRSIPLLQFAPLARLQGVNLLSLQKGPGTDQLQGVSCVFPITDLGSRLDETAGAFMDTAAVMMNLDLVIAADVAIAHLTGALGVPVWLALYSPSDWRWLLERDDSPWYPTMRLFRQARPGNWESVFERMATEVRALLPQSDRIPSITVEIAPGELIDKLTILEIKSQRLTDPAQLRNVGVELAALRAAHQQALPPSEELRALTAELRTVNERLWQVEDEIRSCDRNADFGPRFIELARAVYQNNDRRAVLKRRINQRLGSKIVEEKSYLTDSQLLLFKPSDRGAE